MRAQNLLGERDVSRGILAALCAPAGLLLSCSCAPSAACQRYLMPTTILVADDDDSIRATCADILKSAGYQVLQSSNGRDALAAAHAHLPDLILMDLMMPFMD